MEVLQKSFRSPSEVVQKAFGVLQKSFRVLQKSCAAVASVTDGHTHTHTDTVIWTSRAAVAAKNTNKDMFFQATSVD